MILNFRKVELRTPIVTPKSLSPPGLLKLWHGVLILLPESLSFTFWPSNLSTHLNYVPAVRVHLAEFSACSTCPFLKDCIPCWNPRLCLCLQQQLIDLPVTPAFLTERLTRGCWPVSFPLLFWPLDNPGWMSLASTLTCPKCSEYHVLVTPEIWGICGRAEHTRSSPHGS